MPMVELKRGFRGGVGSHTTWTTNEKGERVPVIHKLGDPAFEVSDQEAKDFGFKFEILPAPVASETLPTPAAKKPTSKAKASK